MKKATKCLIVISLVLLIILVIFEILMYINIQNQEIELTKFQNSNKFASSSEGGFVYVFLITSLSLLMPSSALIIILIIFLMWLIYGSIYLIKKRRKK